MKKIRRTRLRSLFLFLMLGFLSIMFLLVCCYTLLFNSFYRVLEQNTIESEQIRFESIKNYVEGEISKVQYIMAQINLDPSLFPLLNRGNLSAYDYFEANAVFSSRFSRTNYVEYRKNISELIVLTSSSLEDQILSIYGSYHTDNFFNTLYINDTYTQDFWKQQMKEDFYFRLYPVETFESKSYWKERESRILPAALKTNQNHIIVCLIDFDKLLSEMKKTLDMDTLGTFAVSSEQNGLIYTEDASKLGEFENYEQMRPIAGFDGIRKGEDGYFFRDSSMQEGVRYEWFVDGKTISDVLFSMMVKYLIVFGILFLAGIVIAVLISLRVNAPVREMAEMVETSGDGAVSRGGALVALRDSMAEIIRQKDQYRQDMESQRSILKEMFYKSKVQNIYMDYESVSREANGEYKLILFQIHYRNRDDENNTRYTFMLKELISLYVNQYFQETVVFQNEENLIACVVNASHTEEEIHAMILEVLTKLDSEKEIAFFTIAICEEKADITKIQLLYNRAILYIGRRLPLSDSQVIDGDIYKKSAEKYFITSDQTEAFLKAVRAKDTGKIRTALEGIYDHNVRKNVCCLYLGLLTEHLVTLCTKELFGKNPSVPGGNSQFGMISVREKIAKAVLPEDYVEIAHRQAVSLIGSMELMRTDGREDYIISFILAYVEKNYQAEIYLNLLAQELKLSPSYVSSYFKEKTGVGLMDYINSYKIEKAAQVLLSSNQKVKDVAESVGIANVNTFIRLFKKYKDLTPNEFRRSNAEPDAKE